MQALNTLTCNSIDKIFTKLTKTGYLNHCIINSTLALTYLCDIFNKYSQYVSEEDYYYIINAIQCLSDSSCFIDLPDFHDLRNSSSKSYYSFSAHRITEDSVNRLSEDNSLKLL